MTAPATRPSVLLVVALVLGILGMHAVVGPVTPPSGADHAAVTAVGAHGAAPLPAGVHDACPGCHAPAGHHDGHTVVSTCLAVLAGTLLLAVAAVLLLRWVSPVGDVRRAVARSRRASRGPPPHRVSLLQLCLQRV